MGRLELAEEGVSWMGRLELDGEGVGGWGGLGWAGDGVGIIVLAGSNQTGAALL